MSTYLKCKICGLSSNSIFDEATEKTRCELFAHVFEEFTYLKPTYIKKPKPDRLKSCEICGKISSSSRCLICEERLLNEQRQQIKVGFQTDVHIFDEFKNRKYGVCDIVKAHHNVLQSDPERLKSEFIINLVYGTEGKDFYLERKNRRFKNAEI